MKARVALLLVPAWLACSRAAPPPEDPGVRLYHDAVVLFAKLSDDTHDLSYRDPRFDDVLSLCAEVPTTSDLRPKAEALSARIRDARSEAEARDRESAQLQAKAEAAPDFQANQVVLPPSAGVAPAVAGSPAQGGSASPTSLVGSVGSVAPPVGARPFDPSQPRQLPDWYRQKGYFGLKPADTNPAAAPAPAAEAPAEATPASAPAPARTPFAPASKSPPPDSQGPPPIFGLPGPAGHAIAPPPPQ